MPEAEASALEGIGRLHLQDGNPGQAARCLRQALIIYQRAGNPAAQRLQHTLADHGLQPTGWPPSSDKAARSTPNRMTTASRRPR